MTDPSWVYSVSSGSAGLISSGPTIVGNNLVLTLDPSVFIGGYSGTIRLKATPPNYLTPNATSWTMDPTLTGDGIGPVSVPKPANSVATAAPKVSVTKATADKGSVYTVGANVVYNIAATCSVATSGALYAHTATLVDHLPPGLNFVSSNPVGGVYDAGASTVTWTFSDSDLTTMPKGCAQGATGTNAFQVTTTAPATVPASQPLVNSATFSGIGLDAVNPDGLTSSATATVPIQVIQDPHVGPGPGYASVSKTSIAPLIQPGITSGNQYVATYPGPWLPIANNPSYSINSAPASFRATVTYGLVDRYMTDFIDPVPCLDNVQGNVYSSPRYSDPACANPAFHSHVIYVSSPGFDTTINGFGQAYLSGWRPKATLSDGSTITLTASGSVSATTNGAYFVVPSGSDVASFRLPPDPALKNQTLQLTIWGYVDTSLIVPNGGLNQLTNTATAIPELVAGTPLSPVSWSAPIFTVPDQPQLGISKAFGSTGGGPGGSTVMTAIGSIITQRPLVRDIVMTDLLPLGMTWTNPVSSATFTLSAGGSASTSTTTGTVQYLKNYQGSGRDLIRVTLPSSAFDAAGSWTITPPTNFYELSTPHALGVYPNTDQIFLLGSQPGQIRNLCGTPTQTGGGVSPATYQTDDSQDLAGDGKASEGYCENQASLVIQGTGGAFSLTKNVQGDLDSVPRGALGVGNASNGGDGTYELSWNNVGSDTLRLPVIYDILPYVGDTGVSRGQSTVSRDSQFQPVFADATGPAGVIIEYSTSTNPCRNEVFPDASNPGCVSDWSVNRPADPTTVRAVRYFSPGTYSTGKGFTVSLSVTVPVGSVNKIAWNSAATNANDLSSPTTVLLPAEPPKVGLVAPSTPVIATQTSQLVGTAFGKLSDTVDISGTGGAPAALEWTLYGPIQPVDDSCSGLSWNGAPVQASGSLAVTTDGTLTIGPTALGSGGCYSWGYTLSGTDYPYSGESPPGQPDEITTVTPWPPSVSTTANLTVASDGSRHVSDEVTIGGIPDGAPVPTPLTWTLYGPLPYGPGFTCTSLDWSGAAVTATGTAVVSGNGVIATPTTSLTTQGCYSYGESLPATPDSPAVSLAPGEPGETVVVSSPQTTTQSSSERVAPRAAVSDSVTITDTQGGTGQIDWSLVGPVAPANESCASVDWSGAPVVDSGTVAIPSEGTFVTGPTHVEGPGCYSWSDSITSATFPSPTTIAPGAPNEVIEVRALVPALRTQVTSHRANGILTLHDNVIVSGSGLSQSSGSPTSTDLQWALFGPVKAVNGSCKALTWTSSPAHASGMLTITADGTYKTPQLKVSSPGCYSYFEQIAGTTDSESTSSPAGLASETVNLPVPPIPPTPVPPTTAPTTIPVPPNGGGAGGLAYTGARLLLFGVIGVGLLSGGAVLLASRKRGAHSRRR